MLLTSESMSVAESAPSRKVVSTSGPPVVKIVAIGESSAVGDVGVVVIDNGAMSPIKSPVMPTPAVAREESEPEAHAEGNARSRHIEPGIPKPTRPHDHGRSVNYPGIVRWNIDHLGAGGFNDDRFAFFLHFLL